MTSNQQTSDDTTNLTLDLSSTIHQPRYIQTTTQLHEVQQNSHDFQLGQHALFEECTSFNNQSDQRTKQKQAIDIASKVLLDEHQRIIEKKDNELKHLRETTNVVLLNNTRTNSLHNDRPDGDASINHQTILNALTDENTHLKNEVLNLKISLESKEIIEKEYLQQIHRLQLHITELEDWNEDFQKKESSTTSEIKNQEHSDLQSSIDLLKSRNRQLENDLHRLQSQQQHNQVALERLDEYEETIAQLHEELNQLRSNKKKQQISCITLILFLLPILYVLVGDINIDNMSQLLIEERKRYDTICELVEETRLELQNEKNQSKKKILQIEIDLSEKFEQENINFPKQLEIERNERENLQKQINNLQQLKNDEEEENRLKEMYVREMFEKQIIELNEQIQLLESDKSELNYQIDELRQQLQSKDRLIQNFQNFAMTSGAPSINNASSHTQGLSPLSQTSSDRLLELENQMHQKEKQFIQIHSIYNQFLTLLPCEFSSSNDTHLSLDNRFVNLFEQFSTYIGTFSIIQEESDSLKQILIERQDELEKLRTHLELTADKLTQLQEERSLMHKNESLDSDEDELEEILGFQQRAPSRQSLLSITPGEKQQLISQNELLSSLLTEKEQELVLLQQAAKSHEDLLKNLESLQRNLQQMECDKDNKQSELNDIRHILDEKLRENSSLKKEKMFFIEKLAEFERERQEQQSIIQMSSKHSSQGKVIQEDNIEKSITQERPENLLSNNDQLSEISKNQEDESLSYYNEYTRILILYNELVTKYNQLEIDYKSIQPLLQQKNEAYLQCQNELNTYRNLLYHQKKKSDDIDQLRSTLNEREIKIQEILSSENQLQIKKSELESNLKLLEENNIKLKSNQQLFDQIQLDLKRVTHERDLAVVDKKQTENEIEINRKNLLQYEERELKLTNEVERLFKIEKSLRNQLEQLEKSDQEKTKIIHQFASNDEQSQQELLTNFQSLKCEHEKIKESNTNLNIRLQEQIQCTQDLQNSLEQFQQDREQNVNEHLFQYQDSLREQISISARLTNENNELQQRLEDANEVLSSMNRSNDEIKAKEILINKLQIEIDHKDKQILEYSKIFETTNDTRVEKQLVKNILLSYFHTPIDKQQQVIPILSALVGFTQEEYQKVIHSISNNYNNTTSNNWLTGWLSANSSKPKTQSNNSLDQSNKSFAELLIQYVEQQSLDAFSETLSNSNTHECNIHQNPPNSSLSTSDKSTYVSTDQQLTTTISTVSIVEDDINIDNPPSLPKSSILVDDLLKI
ncbi:unnamed protein product [Rotaria socialis]|uniref:GRIP domain-containing protein n=2 Tax=Rotaria socialis TaxID=392032 RepID=A0A818KU50_9BILA|nr:unnamed protein product [Rotaria socialis]